MRRLFKPAIVAVALAAALTACSDDDDDDTEAAGQPSATTSAAPTSAPTSTDAPAAVTITIENFAFGDPLTVAPGTTVTVVNKDGAEHNVAALDDSFRSPDLHKDQTGTFVAPTAPGSYEFTCTYHPMMKGTLIVSATADGVTAPTVEPSTTEQLPGGY